MLEYSTVSSLRPVVSYVLDNVYHGSAVYPSIEKQILAEVYSNLEIKKYGNKNSVLGFTKKNRIFWHKNYILYVETVKRKIIVAILPKKC